MTLQDTVFCEKKTEQIFTPGAKPLIMGILNVTPDSFFDGGKYVSENQWLERAGKMVEEGADIIDIGAYSTRPGAIDISVEEELERSIKVIHSVRKHFPRTLVSADTFRARVAEKAVEAGAHIINDISGGTMDPDMFGIVAELDVPYILMHIQGTPQTMQLQPHYENVTDEVVLFFEERLQKLKKLGLTKVILDPGFGFGKTLKHNYSLLKELEQFHHLNQPLMVGFSRKSMVNKVLNISSKEALNGTTVLNSLALVKGAKILRVHDVKQACEAARLVSFMNQWNS